MQKNYVGQSSFDYAQMGVYADMSETEALENIMRGHNSMMAVLNSRHRSLLFIKNVWQNKDKKVGV